MRVNTLRLCCGLVAGGLATPAWSQSKVFGENHRMLPWDADASLALAVGDVDGDGDADALVGNGPWYGSSSPQERLYLNDGAGLFEDATVRLPEDLSDTRAALLEDVDGDGDFDAFLGNAGANSLYLNDGTGVFADASGQLPTDSDPTEEVALGDVDGDGDPDALLANNDYGYANRLYLNDGAGTFLDATDHLPYSEVSSAVVLMDAEGDGDLDALIGDTFFTGDRLYLNDGVGVFSDASAQILAPGTSTRFLSAADLDADGDVDAVRGGAFTVPSLYVNEGAGVFTFMVLPSTSGDGLSGVVGDVDGDGDPDVVVGNVKHAKPPPLGGGGQNQLFLNNGAGSFSYAFGYLPLDSDVPYGIALADLDGDADRDLFLACWGPNDLYLNDGTGLFARPGSALPLERESTEALGLADVDGDGDLDIVVGNGALPATGSFGVVDRLLLNDGTGLFEESPGAIPAFWSATTAVEVVDVDGDADIDVLVGRLNGNLLYLNDGRGVFTDASWKLPSGISANLAVVSGDVDGDGDPDALFGNGSGTAQDQLYLNDGMGTFSDATAQLPADGDDTEGLAFSDVDGDGDLDVLLGMAGDSPGTQNRLYLGDGSGGFADATAQLPAFVDNTFAVALSDVDNDGDSDALIGNLGFGAGLQNRLYRNEGVGVFVDATASSLPPVSDSTRAVVLGDVDDDGDIDAVIGNGDVAGPTEAARNRLYLNTGAGVFADATHLLPGGLDPTHALALGDLDGDADKDLVIGNFQASDRLFSNLTRQLAWRAPPRIGKTLTMDLDGFPGAPWILAWSPASATIPIAHYGILLLDPMSIFVVGSGPLAPGGTASQSFLIPDERALVGLSLYWQSLLGAPLLLSNLEVTTLTDL